MSRGAKLALGVRVTTAAGTPPEPRPRGEAAAADSVAAQASAGAWPATHLQLLKDFLLGLELFIWLALLVALHEHSLTGSRACRRVQRLNLAVYPLSKKTKGTRKE